MKTFVLTSGFGDEVHITNYGARLMKWFTQVGGEQRNIILGHQNISDYLTDESYLGAIVGPYANRIKNARIDNVTEEYSAINLVNNEGPHQLHGGPTALSEQYWHVLSTTKNTLSLSCRLEDKFNGYPGPIHCVVTYKLQEMAKGDVSLLINIRVTSEKTTIAGPTTHPYFNLSGTSENVNKHSLQLHADTFTELDHSNIATGNIIEVNNTKTFNFKEKKTLGTKGETQKLDDNFIIQSLFNDHTVAHAVLSSPTNDIQLQVFSNYPCLQVYTGEHLSTPFIPHQGVCLEPQFAPNSPNQPNFTFELTTPDKPLNVTIEYRLVKAK
ncbi:MAG: galactose mutarotase [Colwellia sp.]|nr:galactose mutarotase [Colwellia sp.]